MTGFPSPQILKLPILWLVKERTTRQASIASLGKVFYFSQLLDLEAEDEMREKSTTRF